MKGVKIGYYRCSTDNQNVELQLSALKKAGCKTIFKDEGVSGAISRRPGLSRCLKKLEPSDTLVVWKLDRLGRSLRDLITMLDEFKKRGDASTNPNYE
jgi:DNA invertase Pin-like site-specific DNA recombinase